VLLLVLVLVHIREKMNPAKIVGILLACGSGIAFSKA
jgi:hypothetical protein